MQRIIDAAVARGLARRTTEGIRRVGLDEKSFLRGQSYVSLMTVWTGSGFWKWWPVATPKPA